jgi:phage terminase small subunit
LRLRSVNIKGAATFAELAKIGFADIRKAVKWGESVALPGKDGSEVYVAHDVGLLSSTDIDDDTAVAISELCKTKDGFAIKFYDKRAALAELGKHLGLKTKLKLSGGFTLEQLVMASFEPPGEQGPAVLPPRRVDK